MLKRIVLFLYYNPRTQRTKISLNCNMSYDRFILYLNWMEKTGFIKKDVENNRTELVCLSTDGKFFATKFCLDKDSE